MKAALGIKFRAGLLVGCLAGCFVSFSTVRPAWADDDSPCAVPAYLIATESALGKVGEAIKIQKQLDILVIGTGSSALSGADGVSTSYPARMEAALKSKLPNVAVSVTTALQPKKTAAETADSFSATFEKIPADHKPVLTIWQTGTVDALRTTDPDDFRSGLEGGIATLQKSGTDILLMNLQYSPRIETMLAVVPYIDTMRVVAQDKGVVLYDRFSIMRYWSDTGDFDLFGNVHGYAMAKRVHDCIGRSLATMIIDAAHVKPAELGIAR
jgi:hypothetical protein